MRALVLLVCLVVGCLAQNPQPCTPPVLLSGSFDLTLKMGQVGATAHANYTYDAVGERVRLEEVGEYNNNTVFTLNMILLYKEGIMYKLNYKTSTCTKESLGLKFNPLTITKDASFVGQSVLGSTSVVGEGIRVNTWITEVTLGNNQAGKYTFTITDSGCVPISSVFNSKTNDMVAMSFFDNVVGIADPQRFVPPPFCNGVQLQKNPADEQLVSFFQLF